MDKQQLEKVVQAWIIMSLSENRSPEYEANFWAANRLFDYVDNDPETAWQVIDAIRHATNDNKVLGNLAAGHLEDLINQHGEKFIDRFEYLAKNDEDFRRLLGGVWRQDTPMEIWERIQAIALPPKWD